jgi:hypothetical protein
VPLADIWLFVRVYSQWAYGIPPEQVVGTAGGTKYSYDTDGKPILTKEPKLLLNDNDAFSESSMVATTSPTASSLVRYWTALTTASAPRAASGVTGLFTLRAMPPIMAPCKETAIDMGRT